MPKYAKFLKDLLSNKRKLEGLSTVCLNEGCSAVVQNKLPEKLADPGHFTIPYLFGSSTESYALANLGASINLMPYSLYKKLDLGEPVLTRMSLSLADRSVKYPRGIVENVLVKVDIFVFPVDFVILDMEADDQVPLILGRPFLRTAKALIYVFDGKITLRVGEENVTFDVVKSMRNSSSQDDSVYFLDTFISQFERCLDYIFGADLLNQEDEVDVPPEHDLIILVGSPPEYPEVFTVADSTEGTKERPSIEAPPSLELKELPPHLEYAFLDGDSDLPVIISSQLTDDEKSRLVDVLKAHKQAIAWKLMDIKGISPNFCTHRILMEDEYKPRCSVAIFQNMIESSMEVFMDDFSVYGDSFDQCLSNLERMMKRCIETKLMLNWEKCHIMVTEGIVLGHKISLDGIEITRPMTRLLEKDVAFDFNADCLKAFEFLKGQLVNAPILVAPDWSLPFELMCDASDFLVGAVLGQRKDKHSHPIYYASKTLNDAQENYTTTKKKLLAVVFAFDKFRSYLVLSKTIVYSDHAALRYLFAKKDAKPHLIRWILLLSEFDIEIRDKNGAKNVAADHLSRLEDLKREQIREDAVGDKFPHESLMMVRVRFEREPVLYVSAEEEGLPWFSDIVNYLAKGVVIKGMSYQQRRKFFADARHYIWDAPYLFRVGADRVLRRCVSREESREILRRCHEGLTGGHHGSSSTARKVLDSGFYWPSIFKDAHEDSVAHVSALMEKVLARYGVTHRLSTAYHPQTSGQVENAN
ncbi:uncharacterized protein LOC143608259 [Bidens hawaiensis]|uniref:uncharacterized protein LOC143608259 n=1 Tax=Bidens hawaiensis TaxID=980011 RepID=UPI004049841D